MNQISKTKAVELIKNSKGRFFTVTFKKNEDNSLRTINGTFSAKSQNNDLGYLTINERKVGFRNVDTRNIKNITIGGVSYKVR